MKKFMNNAFFCAIFILGTLPALSGAEILLRADMKDASSLAGFSKNAHLSIRDGALVADFPKREKYSTADMKLDAAKFSGKMLRISCDARAESILPKKKAFEGIKLMLSMSNGKRRAWEGIVFPTGDFAWKKFEAFAAVPENLKSITLSIGIQNSAGKFYLKNLMIEDIGSVVPVRFAANMGLRDKVAGDGRGGWTDQGPKQDGWCFFGALFGRSFHGIPFDAEPQGKGILTMRSNYFQTGPSEVTIPIRPGAKNIRAFYLLHTMAWGPQLKDMYVGFATLKDSRGKTQELPIVHNRDVADWYRHIANLANGYGALRGTTGDGNIAGVYMSRFEVRRDLGEIVEVKFRSVPEGLWVILAATLSKVDFPLPKAETTKIVSSPEWLPLKRSEKNKIRAGSALDLSSFMRKGTVDELGRVVIRNGHFVFEKNPSERVRFLTNAVTPNVDLFNLSHAELDDLASEIRRNGYNMVRTHFLDQSIMTGAKKDFEFNASMLDKIDYFLYCMKKNGIYWNFDCMTSWIGYTPGNPRRMNDNTKSFKSLIYHDVKVRENWRKGVEKFLCRVNPYTKTRLIDDPVLVMAVAFNESEFGFWREFDQTWFLPRWRNFLRKKYGTIEKLHAAWGGDSAKFKTFDALPCFNGYERNYQQGDVMEFLLPVEQELLAWYEKQMLEMGFKGVLANCNSGKNQFFNYLRKDMPFIAMNHYHAHPSNWVSKHSYIVQKSAIEQSALVFRNFMGTRLFGKPFVVTEQNFAFWNRYRYEQGFVVGGYGAFQNFDALTCHGSPVSFRKVNDIQTFGIWMDPVAKASEILTYFLFIRGDVASAPPQIRIREVKKDCLNPDRSGSLSTEQSVPALLAGFSIECTEKASEQKSLVPGEIAYRVGSTNSVVVNNAGYSSATDNPVANTKELLLHLRKSGILSKSNRTDGRNIFESSTGELLMNVSAKFMRISTPRLQGVCATAGTVEKMPDFEIRKMTADGNLALVSIDGMKKISKAERLLLVYATDVLNSGMEFSSADRVTLLDRGHGPSLLKRSAFTVAIKAKNPSGLRMYPLDMAGNRLKKILPEKIEGGFAVFSADTGKDGAALYFEIAEK